MDRAYKEAGERIAATMTHMVESMAIESRKVPEVTDGKPGVTIAWAELRALLGAAYEAGAEHGERVGRGPPRRRVDALVGRGPGRVASAPRDGTHEKGPHHESRTHHRPGDPSFRRRHD
jgi:hypothetical protein